MPTRSPFLFPRIYVFVDSHVRTRTVILKKKGRIFWIILARSELPSLPGKRPLVETEKERNRSNYCSFPEFASRFFCRLDQVFPASFPFFPPSSSSVLGRIGGCSVVEAGPTVRRKKRLQPISSSSPSLPPFQFLPLRRRRLPPPNPRKGPTHFCQRWQIIFIFASFVRFAERRFKIATTLYLQAPFVFRASG